MVAQQRTAARPQSRAQLTLISRPQPLTCERLRPQRTRCRDAGVNIGQIVLHAVQLAVNGQRHLCRIRRRNTGGPYLIAHRTAYKAVVQTAECAVCRHLRNVQTHQPVYRTQHAHQSAQHQKRDILCGVLR